MHIEASIDREVEHATRSIYFATRSNEYFKVGKVDFWVGWESIDAGQRARR